MTSKQRKREVRKRVEAAKSAFFAFFDLFDSRLTQNDSDLKVFCEVTDILQQLRQLQHQHRESNLFDLLHDCFHDSVLDWFKNQSKFISVHHFDITFTKAFFSKSSVSQKQQMLKISTPDRCQWCQLDYETWNSHRLQYSSCVAQNQQAYEFVLQFFEEHASQIIEKSSITISSVSFAASASQKQQQSNVLKIAKKIKFNAIKNAKRVKSKALKAEETAKSTSTFQDIDIFDSILTCDDRRFSESEEFLQHLQQCQHQYRKSDLFTLLLACLWGVAFDIWFDKQTIMKSTSLTGWIDILRVDFANVSFAKSKVNWLNIICMRCDSNFHFKEKLREHVREQHAKKFVNSSFLSINTVKSVCEARKNSVVTCSSDSSISQESETSTATSKQIFESMIFEAVTSSKNSHLTSTAPETVSELMKNTSIQCSFTSSKSSPPQTLESEHHELVIQKSERKSSLLKISSNKSVCESEKNSTVTSSSASFTSFSSVFKRSCSICRIVVISIKEHYLEYSSCHEALHHRVEQQLARRASQREQKAQKQTKIEKAISQFVKNSHLSINAVNFVREIEKTSFASHKSKSTKRTATCRRCNQIFNFNNKFHEHIRQHHARKSVKSSDFSFSTLESACKLAKNSTIICSFFSSTLLASFTPQKLSIFSETSRSQKFWFSIIFESVIASTRSCLSFATLEIASKRKKIATFKRSFTFSLTSFRTFVRKHQEFYLQKSHLTMNDLIHMFNGKSKSFDLQQHQNLASSQQNFDFRQFDRSCSTSSKRFHLTIENLFEMFDEKSRKKSLFQSQNNVSSQTFSDQMQIIVYFKSTVNQKSLIIQNSKNSKSKSLSQHMLAEFIRTAFSKSLFEKSIDLSYKLPDVFCHLKFSNSNKIAEIVFFIFILFRLLSILFLALAIVSIMSVATMNCINVYEQIISIIDRVIQYE